MHAFVFKSLLTFLFSINLVVDVIGYKICHFICVRLFQLMIIKVKTQPYKVDKKCSVVTSVVHLKLSERLCYFSLRCFQTSYN